MSDRGAGLAADVLRETIAALARADAPALERLAIDAEAAVVPATEAEAARESYAALGLLLGLTRRNLRLLQGEHGARYSRS